MIKRVLGILLLCLLFFASALVLADNNSNASVITPSPVGITVTSTTGSFDKGYVCLEGEVKNRTSFTFEEAIFGTLALGYRTPLDQVITTAKSPSLDCWPSSGCKIKDTAQVGLAYLQAGKDTTGIENWLSALNQSTTELQWYLEVDIDNHGVSKCSVTYDGTKRNFEILDSMQISNGAGNCLSVAPSGLWLRISNSNGCLDKKYEVSCDQDFITTLLYQRTGISTVFISPNTHSASSSGMTEEQVNSKCFKIGGSCDYEGTLWATLFMQKKGKDISGFTPYLSVYASDNEKYFPSSFLYLLSGGDDQYTRIIQLQKQNKFWELTASPYNKFYDTSVALMALSSGAAAEGENAKNYLLSIQGKNGCWDKFRDTAFILYSAAYKRGAGTPGASALCEEVSGQSCARETACLDAGGSVRSLFECGSPFDICCSIEVPTLTCSESGGSVCSSSLECSGRIVSASDGSCCMEDCVTPTATEAVCNDICAVSCGTGETEVYGTCDGIGEVCCAPQTSSGGGFWTWFWIILLILLIALVILAIVFKDKIKLWNYKRTGKVSSNPVNRSTPGGPTRPSGPMLMQRPMARPALAQRPTQTTRTVIRPSMPARPVRKPGSTDMDETLRKLKEMTK